MYIQPKTLQLTGGKTAILKSPELSDAAAVLECMRLCAEQTHFLLCYPEEIILSEEDEQKRLKQINEAADDFMLVAFIDGILAGNAGVLSKNDCAKIRHRGEFGIGIKKEFWNIGLGTCMLAEVLSTAEKTRFEQIELGVFADNTRAKRLYEKAGFVQTGIIPHAYKLKDGTYRDEIQMIRMLNAT